MDTLPNELFALIIDFLDTHSLTALILTCKYLLKRSNNKELVDIITSGKEVNMPRSRLLIARDYLLVKPREFVPVYECKQTAAFVFDLFLQRSIGNFYFYDCFKVVIEISVNREVEFVKLYYRRNPDGDYYCDNEDDERSQDSRDDDDYFYVSVGYRDYKIHKDYQSIPEIISFIYDNKRYRIVKITVEEV